MVLSLLFNRKYAATNIAGVFLDATINEDHNYTSRVTSYPVEDGTIVSDYIIKDPETVDVTGVVSDTPLSILSSFNRSVSAFNRLEQIYRNRELITIITGIKTYTTMAMTSLSVPRNVQTGQSLTFSMSFKKVYLSTSIRTSLDPNDPFNKTSDKIPREIVADANKYPIIQQDPVTSLKDQASSSTNVGIQDLQPISPQILPNILLQVSKLQGVV